MAASAPAANRHTWSDNPDSTTSLEVGIAGMSLVSNVPEAPGRTRTGSTVSSSSPTGEDLATQQVSTSNSEPQQQGKTSDPSSPLNEKQPDNATVKSRPPGLSVPGPSTGGKPGHSKNNSSSSSMVTLTPSSSLDGNSEWHNMGRQASSPFHGTADVPSLPYLSSEHRMGGQIDEGSRHGDGVARFDPGGELDHNDGLLGLDALRERSHSSPGPPSTAGLAPSPRGQFAPHGLASQLEQSYERTRLHPRDRPPLSHPYADGYSPHQSERSVGAGTGLAFGVAGRAGAGDNSVNNVSMESAESRGSLGVIGRPDLWQHTSEFDARSRSSAPDAYYPSHHIFAQAPVVDPIAEKFGSLPTLGTHIQQHRVQEASASRPKTHIRSVSQPVMNQHYDSRYIHGMGHGSNPFPGDGHMKPANVSRSASISHSTLPRYEGGSYDATMSGFNGGHASYQPFNHQALQRREALDFHQFGSSSQPTGSAVGTSDEFRGLSSGRMISPGQSPLHSQYSGHSRQPSDATSSVLLSSSPLSASSGLRGSVGSIHRHHITSDEDLAHPLVGENIEVPDHDEPYFQNPYMMSQGAPLPMVRSHVHSMSLDGLPGQYLDAPRHLPTAGSALPLPKVVYSVKFKRTQRNFVLGPRINRDLKIGTYVKVEADRGEDLGIVVGKVPAERYNFSGRASFTAGMGPPGGLGGVGAADLKRIIRLATHDEVSLLTMKREEEEELLKICRGKVRQRGLPMNVVDAEYQFDRHKLTFFFEAEGRVDFRELVRDLFSMYKTRIWMQQLDKNTSTSSQAIMSPQASNLQIDYGTPIIAPASEFADSIVLGSLAGPDSRTH